MKKKPTNWWFFFNDVRYMGRNNKTAKIININHLQIVELIKELLVLEITLPPHISLASGRSLLQSKTNEINE